MKDRRCVGVAPDDRGVSPVRDSGRGRSGAGAASLRRAAVLSLVAIGLALAATGCGGGSAGGSGIPSKAPMTLAAPAGRTGKPLTVYSAGAPPRDALAPHPAAQGSLSWWYFDAQPGVEYCVAIWPASGDQDLYVHVNGRWASSTHLGTAEEKIGFTVQSAQRVWIAVNGYQAGNYTILADHV